MKRITLTLMSIAVVGFSFAQQPKEKKTRISSNFSFLNTTASEYCSLKGNVRDEYIQKVELGDISNSSDGGSGYSDFTSISTTLKRTKKSSITITPKWTGTVYEEGYAVYIDYNQDKDFDDEGETVFKKEPSKDTSVTGTFTVPASALTGKTRMRIILEYKSTPKNACNNFEYGEIEDYTLNIEKLETEAPTAPTNLTVSNIKDRTATLNWTASTDNVGIKHYKILIPEKSDAISTTTSFNLVELTPDTEYTISVIAVDTSGNESTASKITLKTEKGPEGVYCVSKGKSVKYEHIQKVEIGDIKKSSDGGTGYSDFTSISTTLKKSEPVKIIITPKWSETIYKESYVVYIDYNQDKDFDDEGEMVFRKEPSKDTSITGTFTVPGSAINGQTRMRIAMKDGTPAKACEIFEYGEVEDYTIIIDDEAPTTPTNLTVSNIEKRTATLNWTASTDNLGINKYAIYINDELYVTSNQNKVDLEGLEPNTQYTFSVSAFDKANNESAKSLPITFTTKAPPAGEYCKSKSYDPSYLGYIEKVKIGSIDNTSDGSNGYSDFTAKSTVLKRNQEVSITITPKRLKSFAKNGYAVYIDYNNDKDFNDEGEKVWSIKDSNEASVTGTFTVPASAKNVLTRMRISSAFNEVPRPCALFQYGEVEDYTIIIDDEAPTTPTNLTVSNIEQRTATLSWNASEDNLGVYYYIVYVDGKYIYSPNKTTEVIKYLLPSTQYTLEVVAVDRAGNESSKSEPITFTTKAPPAGEYCESKSYDPSYSGHIEKVKIGTIDNTSEKPEGYSDFTAISTILKKGEKTEITITPKKLNSYFRKASYAVYIDYNLDNDFQDEGEKVWSLKYSNEDSVKGTFTIPKSAKDGRTRMRVSCSFSGLIPEPCEFFSSGEVEDYTVIIDNEPPTAPTNLTVSDIKDRTATVNWTASTDNVGIKYYKVKVLEKADLEKNVTTTSFSLAELTPNTEYTVSVTAVDLSNNESSVSSVTFKTDKSPEGVYCTSKGKKVEYEYIQKVELGDINNSSDGGSGYSDFTSISAILKKSDSAKITITSKKKSENYKESYIVYIDYNQDKDFDDEGEIVFTKEATKDSLVVGTFIVPESALEGKTRMRISLKDSSLAKACEIFGYGEVEDYSIFIGEDKEAPTAPTNVTVSDIEKRTATINWTASTDNLGIDYYKIYVNDVYYDKAKETSKNIGSLIPATEYIVYVVAVDKAGYESPKSDSIKFTTKSPPAGVYCESKSKYPSISSYIKKVELGTINNTSGSSAYTDFTSISTELVRIANIKITKGVPQFATDTYAYAVFIDYNQDGDFQDEGETVFTKEATKDVVIKESFRIPNTAKSGKTRMRISIKSYNVPTPCEFFLSGEVEDYSVIIKDTQSPTIPTNLLVSNIKESSATLSWDASTDNVGVDYYAIQLSTGINLTSKESSLNVKSLSPNTEYTAYVEAVDKSGNKSPKQSIKFKTLTSAYCSSKGEKIKDEFIQKVEIGSINNSADTSSGYTDFTSISTSLTKKEVTTITITPKWTGTVYNEGYTVYIDYNQDKDFDDEGEKVFSKEPSKDSSIKGSFTIPESAKTGKTRMRVSLKYNGVAKGCEVFGYGEVEDYSVIIEEKTNVSTRNLDVISVYPNPTSNFFNISSNLDMLNKAYRIINISGQIVKTGVVGQNSIDISNLPLGVYTVEVFDGQKVLITKIIKSN